jgi:glycosyltransferase involved in cell wall biosynthesis
MSENHTPLKIIAIGYNTSGTGLTRVMHSIMRRLAPRHEIHYLGIGYSGDIIRDQGLTIYPTNPRGGDVFAAFQAIRMIDEVHPDLLFILHDVWFFSYYLRLFEPFKDRLKIVCYIPIDGKIINEEDAAWLEKADRVVAYTEFARKEFEQAFDRLQAKGDASFPAVDVVPHGVDLSRFYPTVELQQANFASPARARVKREVFGQFSDHDDSFIVLNASRPDKRKRLDLTFAGFASFAENKPANVRLCLHQAIKPEDGDAPMQALIRQYKLQDRVILNPFAEGIRSDEELNRLYNACDIGINTSMGEGWGLVSFEHAAAGAAQIVPDHTACQEIWRDCGELIPLAKSYIPQYSILEMGEVSIEGVAEALEKLYRSPQRREQLAQAGNRMTQNPAYTWDSIANRFEEIFLQVAG